jgi:hypothetical protein
MSAPRRRVRRTVSFWVADGVGDPTRKRGTMADLLEAVPYLLVARLVPPWHVVNDLLRSGGSDAGMSGACTWEPFEITRAEWAELARELAARPPKRRCTFVEPPDWVQTFEDWHAWIMIFKYGLPDEYREVDREYRELERARAQAANAGQTDLAEELRARAGEAADRLSQLVMTHRRSRDA